MGTDLGPAGSLPEERAAALHARASDVRAGLDALLHPRSIAVVGASSDPRTIAGMLFGNLVASPFTGAVLPVNRSHSSVQGVPAFPDLPSCPVVPDLVVVCVPARAVPDVVTEAGALGVAAACVISAGFAETGPEGAALEREVLARAAAHGVRLVGPNCTGVLGGTGDTRYNVTFGRVVPQEGGAVLLSQSGALGLAVLEAAQDRGIGVGGFVSVGNCADLSAVDLLQYWGLDPAVDLVLLYLESIPDARSLVRVAQQVSSRVPIVAVKAGRTEAGGRAAASHTAALASGDRTASAVLEQAGIVRADSIEEMLDLASVLQSYRTFRGRRVAIVTNGGGPGILAADACELNGLVVPPLSVVTMARLRPMFPPEASVGNPVDMIAGADADQYGRAVRALEADADVDAQVVVFNTPLLTSSEEVAAELVATRPSLAADRPMLAVFMNRDGPPTMLRTAGIPSFVYPENAARSLARCIGWASRRARGVGAVRRPDVNADRVAALLASAVTTDDGWLTARAAQELTVEYGIAVPRSRLVATPAEAAAAQAELDRPVVVKVASAIHKSDIGGVRVGITTPDAAADAVRLIRDALAAVIGAPVDGGFLVQEQVEGQEMIVGARRDPLVGPLVMVGVGGGLVELLDDVAVRLAPVTGHDVEDMLMSLRSYRLLTGYRGRPAADVDALSRVVHAVSALVDELPQVLELDLNPVFVLPTGAVAADVRIRLGGLTPTSADR